MSQMMQADRYDRPAASPAERPAAADEAAGDLARVADHGFLLVDAAAPGQPAASQLLVALQDAPRPGRFDPAWILYWASSLGRGYRERLDGRSPARVARPFSWGPIRVFDRRAESQAFITFGGTMRVERTADGARLARFDSPAPILRWTGHGQEPDKRAADAECFFARMMVPIDFVSGAEERIAAAAPMELYAAMVGDLQHRLRAEPADRDGPPSWAQWVAPEVRRLRASQPDTWAGGARLLVRLGLLPTADVAAR